jgi:hypothetical protein
MRGLIGVCFGLVSLTAFAQDAEERLRQEYEERRLMAPQNAKGQFDLGKWCERKRLREEAIKAYERAVEIDPEYEPARKALGHKKVLGRWTSEKDYADSSWWAHPKVDQKRVDEAVIKGVNYLLNQVGKWPDAHSYNLKFRYDELVLLTVLESGWDRRDPRVTALIDRVVRQPLDYTYHVALRAMCLAALDPLKYQQFLAQCAQYLVDTQGKNGQWSYGKPVPHLPAPGQFPTTDKGPIPNISTGLAGDLDPRAKAAPQPKQIEIRKGQNAGPDVGDNSNSQYAALGIRACLSGLVVVPKETIAAAERWWESRQLSDGGWGYDFANFPQQSWGSMTAGAVGCLAIYKYYRARIWGDKVDWKGDASIARGTAWLGQRLSYGSNPSHPFGNLWHHYWIYAVERAGRLLETEQLGAREWYPDGANWLLSRQNADGSWQEEAWGQNPKSSHIPGPVSETCFAILFLRRATPRLDDTIKIETGERRAQPAGEAPRR